MTDITNSNLMVAVIIAFAANILIDMMLTDRIKRKQKQAEADLLRVRALNDCLRDRSNHGDERAARYEARIEYLTTELTKAHDDLAKIEATVAARERAAGENKADRAKRLLDGMRQRAAKLDQEQRDEAAARIAKLRDLNEQVRDNAAKLDKDGEKVHALDVAPNFMKVDYTDPATGINYMDIAAVYLDGEKVRARSYNIREGWIEESAPARRYGTVAVTLHKDGGLA